MEIPEHSSSRKSTAFWAGGLSLCLHGLLAVVLGCALPLDGRQGRGHGEGLSLSLMSLSARGEEPGEGVAPFNEGLAHPLRTAAAPATPQETPASASEQGNVAGAEAAGKTAAFTENKVAPQKKNVTQKAPSAKKAVVQPSKNDSPRAAEKSVTLRKKQALASSAEVGGSSTSGKDEAGAPLADSRKVQGEGGVAEVPFGRACGPAFRHFSRPVYPLQARRAGISGLVKLRVSLDDAGTVRSVEVLESGHRLLSDAACESIRLSSFRPYTENGKSLPSRTIIPIRFSLEQTL